MNETLMRLQALLFRLYGKVVEQCLANNSVTATKYIEYAHFLNDLVSQKILSLATNIT